MKLDASPVREYTPPILVRHENKHSLLRTAVAVCTQPRTERPLRTLESIIYSTRPQPSHAGRILRSLRCFADLS
jgi:hypothetical protein